MSVTEISENQEMTRGQKLWNTLREKRDTEPLSVERAKLVTASYKETEVLPIQLRRAKAFEKIVTEIPIYIDDGQLLAGDLAARPMAAECYIEEGGMEAPIEDFRTGNASKSLREEDLPVMEELADYWATRSAKAWWNQYMGETNKEELDEMMARSEEGAWIHEYGLSAIYDKGWLTPNYPKVIKDGFLGIIDEVEDEIKATRMLDDAAREKVYLLQGLSIVLKAGIKYSQRYAVLARELAKKAEGKRKKELERLAEVCDRVPAYPARNFYEALQALWFCHTFIILETRQEAIALGRVDQYLYPYYKQDIENGTTTREEVIEILECLRVKLSTMRDFASPFMMEATAGEAKFHNCTLGGVTADGKDATNEMSFLWLEAAMRARTPHPTLSVRVHENMSQDFAMKAAELCRLGLGYPAWFGDRTTIQYLVNKGHTLEEARDFALCGCVIHPLQHNMGPTFPLVANIPKIFEIALNDGVDPRLDRQFGPTTGKFGDFSFDDLYEAFKKQTNFFLRGAAQALNEKRLHRIKTEPQMMLTCLFDDCIKRGEPVGGGGALYQHSMNYLLPVGVMDVADSLAAIKKCVFEDGSVSKQELMDALKVNFEGKESVRRLLMNAPKYGNGDEYADSIAADLYDFLVELCDTIDGCYGGKFVCAPHNLSFHGACGSRVGALPSGRLAGLALADGAVSACHGADNKGPTALLRSAGRINHAPIYGTLLNMKFHPSALKTKDDLEKFVALIKTYLIDFGGKHIQFNVVDRETLLDAQEHPENYQNLIVRVAGYSALWVELNRDIQNDIIGRTEHVL